MTPRVLLVGAGAMGRRHLRRILSGSSCRCAGWCDPAVDALPEFPGIPHWSGLKEALASACPDAAVIVTPPPEHAAVARLCLEARVAVLLEKPLASSADGAEALVTEFRQAGVLLQAAMVERFNPVWSACRDWLRSSNVRFVRITRQGGTFRPAHGISVGPDLAVHDLDLLLEVFPDLQCEGVAGDAADRFWKLRAGEVNVTLHAAWNRQPRRCWEVSGSQGTRVFDFRAQQKGMDALEALHADFVKRQAAGSGDPLLERAVSALRLAES